MVAIPAIKDSLFCVTGYRAGSMEGALRVVHLTCGMKVKRLEVNCVLKLAVLLCTYDHAVVPRDRLPYVLVKSCLDFLLPVEWFGYGSVMCNRFYTGVDH